MRQPLQGIKSVAWGCKPLGWPGKDGCRIFCKLSPIDQVKKGHHSTLVCPPILVLCIEKKFVCNHSSASSIWPKDSHMHVSRALKSSTPPTHPNVLPYHGQAVHGAPRFSCCITVVSDGPCGQKALHACWPAHPMRST